MLTEFGSNVIAILLTGSFGRGEGGVLVDNSGIIKIINDYDLHVFTKKRVSKDKIKKITNDLAISLGVDVCITVQPIYTFRFLKKTQYGYDLKHGSYVIYGDSKILRKIPYSRCLPPREIERLLFTRAWCFLGSIKKYFPNTSFTFQEKFFLFNQLSKALLALEEGILIRYCDYHPSYVEKLKKISKYCSDEKMLEYFKWTTNFKLKPTCLENKDIVKFYFEVKEIFFNNMFKLIKGSYNKNFNSWVDYLNWFFKRYDTKIQVFLRFLWHKNLSYDKFIKVKIAQVALAVAFNHNQIDEVLTDYAEKVLSKIERFRAPTSLVEKWWSLRELALKLQEIYEE